MSDATQQTVYVIQARDPYGVWSNVRVTASEREAHRLADGYGVDEDGEHLGSFERFEVAECTASRDADRAEAVAAAARLVDEFGPSTGVSTDDVLDAVNVLTDRGTPVADAVEAVESSLNDLGHLPDA